MTPNLSNQQPAIMQPAQQDVAVSLLLPFEPRATAKKVIEAAAKRLLERAEQLLLQQASRQTTRQVMSQLKLLIDQLDYSAGAKSVALWASPDKSKMVYWQMAVNETVELAPEFDARRLIQHRREDKQYLLLVIGDHYGGIYLGNGKTMSRLVANAPVNASGAVAADRAGNAETVAVLRTVTHFDNALGILLKAYDLPFFVVAPSAHIAGFKAHSKNAGNATALIEVPVSINEFGLKQVMSPYINKWQELKEQRLLVQAENALGKGKLAVGISEVWTAAVQKRGRVLLVEADYAYPAYINEQEALLYADAIPLSETSRQTKDVVSDAIACVLASGGRVEIVDNGLLSGYLHIAMIVY